MALSRWCIAVLTAVLLTACSAEEQTRRASTTPPTTPAHSPGDGGALDGVAEEEPLDQQGDTGLVHDLVLDADGEPVVTFASLNDEPVLVSRRDGDEWVSGRLNDPPVEELDSTPLTADDGTLMVTGFVDGRFSFTRVDPDGVVTTVPLASDVGAGDVGFVEPALTPDGSSVYLGVVDRESQSQVLAVDPSTGTVRAEYHFPTEAAGLIVPRDIRVVGDQVVMTVNRGVDPSENRSAVAVRPWLVRFDRALRLLSEVQLADSSASAWELDVADDGTALVAMQVGEYATPGVEIRLVQVAPDATSPAIAARFPGDDLVEGLAVDPAGEWAYLSGLDDGDEEHTTTVTSVDLTGALEPETQSLCENSGSMELAITPDGTALLLATGCVDRDIHATLFTLR